MPAPQQSWACERGFEVKARVARTIPYVVLVTALMFTAAIPSIVSLSQANAASTAFVQGGDTQVGSGTTASLAFSSANTSGNLIVVYVVWDNPGTVTVSDTRGNIYTAATARQTWGSNWSAQAFYASNILGGSNTVKATFGTAIKSFGIVYLHEYSGLATASPVDVSASAAGTSASMSSGAVTTTQANDLLFAAGASANTVTTPGTGFTTRLTGFGNLTEDRVVTTTGSYAGTATQNASSWVMQLVAFRVASTVIGPAAKLAFVQGPSNTVAGAVITPAVKVAVEDANGNVETSDNTTKVSLAIGTNPAGGTLSGGSAVTVASGIATFSGLSINTAGTGYTLTASSTPAYSAATSATFNITTGTSSDWTTYLGGNDRSGFASSESGFNPTSVPNLGLAWQTSDAGPSHGVFSQPIVSNGLVYWGSFDGYERATTTSGNLVWQQNLGTDTSSGCTDPSEAGVASTATVTTDVPVGTATSVLYVGGGDAKMYALNAATGAVLWSYAVGPNSEYFVWSSPAVFGNSVYIGVASFGGGTDSGSSCPEIQGQLLQLNRVTGALQNTFDVVPNGCTGGGVWSSPTVDAAAGTIYFGTGSKPPPGGCTSEPLAAAVVEVNASDLSLVGSWAVPPAQQSDDSDFGATPTLFNGVIGGQSEPLVGVINKNGIFYAFERGALPSGPVWSTQIAIGGGDPTTGQGDVASAAFDGTTLYVGGDATNSCSGSLNALNPSTGAFIWQHCFTDGGYVLGGVTSASGGVVAVGEGNNIAVLSAATGASLFTYAGTGTFWGPPSIADGTLYEGDMAGNLYALTVNQKPAAKLAFVQGPSNTVAGAVITPAVKVAVEDANGNVETSDNTTKVSLAIGTNPAGGTLSGGSAVTVASGIATFSGLSINTAGTGYTLTASSTPAYSAATSATFNITTVIGPAAKLGFVQGPSNTGAGAVITPAVKVAVEDANGNVETSDNTTKVSLAIGTNPAGGTLSGGSAVTVASGIATFSGLSINTAGTGYTLTASSTPAYSAATSATFNITTGASAHFVQGGDTQVGSGTTASLAFSSANTSGNLIVVYVVWDNPGTVTVSDTRGNIYTAATARQTWGSNWSAQAFYASNILGGSNTVKATFGTAIKSFGIVYLHEYSGLATASPVDVSASAAGTSASMSSGAVTTTQANDLLFAAGASANTVTTPGTGFTTRLTGFGNLTEDRVVTTTGSYAGTATQNASSWVMQLVAFRVA